MGMTPDQELLRDINAVRLTAETWYEDMRRQPPERHKTIEARVEGVMAERDAVLWFLRKALQDLSAERFCTEQHWGLQAPLLCPEAYIEAGAKRHEARMQANNTGDKE